jgi:general secretion pathway protein C
MPARLSAFVIWALVAGSAVFWLLRLVVSAPQAPAQTVAVSTASVLRGDLSRLLGAPPSAAPAGEPVADVAGRFRLIGVMAPRGDSAENGQGIALIAIDGKPARPYRIGAPVDGELVLQSVSQRGAAIGPRAAAPSVRLELPPLPAAATGTLPPAAAVFTATATAGGAARPAAPPPVPAPPMPASPAPPPAAPPEVATPPAGVNPAAAGTVTPGVTPGANPTFGTPPEIPSAAR